MDFRPSDRVVSLLERVRGFSEEHVISVEDEALAALDEEVRPGVAYPAVLVDIRERAKAEGLWNLFLPDEQYGPGLTNWEYGMLDRAMQVHGALGMSDDVPLALAWRQGRWLRIADGPDEVHKASIARRELNRFKPEAPAQRNGAPAGVRA